MLAIVFFLRIEIYQYVLDRNRDIDQPQYVISFFDNQGKLYSARDPYFNELTVREIYNEFIEGKCNGYLTVNTTCDLDKLHENYELLKSVAEKEELQLIPDSEVTPSVEGDTHRWSAFYYNEDGNLSWVEIRKQSSYPCGVIYRADDERAD